MTYRARNAWNRSNKEEDALLPWRTVLFAVLLFGVLAVSETPAAAQEPGRIAGQVSDAGAGAPVSGVQVYIEGLRIGTLSRGNGSFVILSVPPGTHQIVAERLGLRTTTQQVTVGAGATVTVDFVLELEALGLDEIVVTGTAGAARRREIGNSIAQIVVADLADRPVSVVDLLQGAAPGLDVSATGGELGVAPAIRLRGNASVSMSNNPIIYIDGVRMRSEPLAHVGAPDNRGIRGSNTSKSPLNSINPNDIERIEVIKGSAATTLYGTEASAGVIQIFTKRGIQGAPQWAVETQQGAVWSRTFGTPEFPYLRMKPFIKTGHNQYYSASVRGGLEDLQYFVSGSFSDQEGYLPNEFSDEYIIRGNFTFAPARDLTLQWNTAYSREQAQQLSQSNAQGLGHNVYRGDANYFGDDNPDVVAQVLDFDIRHGIDRLTTGGTATYSPLANLTNRLTIGYDWVQQDTRNLRPFGFVLRPRGALLNHHWQNTLLTFDYVGTYSFDLTSALRSNFSWGGQAVSDEEHTVEAWGEDFPGADEPTVNSAADTQGFEERERVWNAGFFFQNVFDFENKYFLTLGFRVDGNSAFGEGFGLQTYPKASFSWVASDEDWWDPGWGSVKVRAAWGKSGRAPGAFDAVRTWETASINGEPAFVPRNVGNPDLGPEVTQEFETGFDASILGDRVQAEFTYYSQKTTDALIRVLQTPSGGFQRSQLQNIGEIKNSGVEVSIFSTLYQRRDWGWDLGLTVSTNHSEAVDLGGAPTFGAGGGTFIVEGQPVPVIRGRIVTNPDDIADPVIVSDHIYGPNFATLIMSPNTRVRLPGGISLSVTGEFKGGHFIQDGNVHGGGVSRGASMPMCWPYYEDPGVTIVLKPDTPALWRARCTPSLVDSDHLTYEADFFRLRSVSAQIPVNFAFPNRVNDAMLTVALNNSWTWIKDMPILDPEMRGNQGGLGGGTSLGNSIAARNPTPISFRASLRVTF